MIVSVAWLVSTTTISSKDLNAVVEWQATGTASESKDGDVVALQRFDLDSKERSFSPDVVLCGRKSLCCPIKTLTTCPVIDGWSVGEWIRGLANNVLMSPNCSVSYCCLVPSWITV